MIETSNNIMETRSTTKIGQIVLTKAMTVVDPQLLNGSGLFGVPVISGAYDCYRETAEINGEKKTVSFKILLSSDIRYEVQIPEENDLEFLGNISVFDRVGFFNADDPDQRTEDFFGILGCGIIIQEHFAYGNYGLFGAKDDSGLLYAAKITFVNE